MRRCTTTKDPQYQGETQSGVLDLHIAPYSADMNADVDHRSFPFAVRNRQQLLTCVPILVLNLIAAFCQSAIVGFKLLSNH